MKFKTGDRIVWQADNYEPEFGTVTHADFKHVYVIFDGKKEEEFCLKENFEFEQVFNSPLYKALT